MEVTVTPTFQLYFYALETLPSNLDVSLWLSIFYLFSRGKS